MGMVFVPTWLRQVSSPPLFHKTTLTTASVNCLSVYYVIYSLSALYVYNLLFITGSNHYSIVSFQIYSKL